MRKLCLDKCVLLGAEIHKLRAAVLQENVFNTMYSNFHFSSFKTGNFTYLNLSIGACLKKWFLFWLLARKLNRFLYKIRLLIFLNIIVYYF